MLTFILLTFSPVIMCESIISGLQEFSPPAPKYGTPVFEIFNVLLNSHLDNYEWERSGLFEGDIAMYNTVDRNAVINTTLRWPNATIPFHIEENHFSDDEIKVILKAFKEFHEKTCLRFAPYKLSDESWILITSNDPGCFSYVGMQSSGGQLVNLHRPGCVKKGIVQHELLHAAGLYHQQSSSNRDEYVEIIWENIEDVHKGNFKKYNTSIVTDYGIEYDYDSIMHYSSKAFSKNGNATIVAKKNVTRLGQRDGFTEKDILKLNQMYKESCHEKEISSDGDSELDIINWFKSLLQN